MKPFDLELAKQGHPVCTRRGEPARILCFDRKHTKFPIIALYGKCESYGSFSINGKFLGDKEDNDDLMMTSAKTEGWVNIYPKERQVGKYLWWSENDAKASLGEEGITIKIEWEE